MKKFFLLVIAFLLLLCSCDKKEYSLIELSSSELLDTLFKEDASIVIAYYDSNDSDSDKFLDDLRNVSKTTKENIYYIDVNHVSGFSVLMLYEFFGVDASGLKYFAVQDGKVVVNEEYTDYKTLLKNLNGKSYDTDIKYLTDEDKDIYIAQADTLYKEGNISGSLDVINSIWSFNDAKDYYKNHDLFKIINSWENYKIYDDGKYMDYTSILFYSFTNSLDIYKKKVLVESFEAPEMNDYVSYFYKVVNGDLLISETEDGTYKKIYTIDSYDDKNLVLVDKDGYKNFNVME